MTQTVGRIAYPKDVEWTYDTVRKTYVEPPEIDELDQIGRAMTALDREQAGLVRAVRLARAKGYTWDRIGAILGITRQGAWKRFKEVDAQLLQEGKALPGDADTMVEEPEPVKPVRPPRPAAPVYDFSSLKALPTDEVIAMADTLPADSKLFDAYLVALREAIVVTLYNREVNQRRIAEIIGKSRQRVSQMIVTYYNRVEQDWAAERAQWQHQQQEGE